MKTLCEWRIERLLGVKAVAAASGVSNATSVSIEHGKAQPKPRTINRLSKALEVAPHEVEEFAAVPDAMSRQP